MIGVEETRDHIVPVSPRIGSGGPMGMSLHMLMDRPPAALDGVAAFIIPAMAPPRILRATAVASIESEMFGGRSELESRGPARND